RRQGPALEKKNMTIRYLPGILTATARNANRKRTFFADFWPVRFPPLSARRDFNKVAPFSGSAVFRPLGSLTFPGGLEILKRHSGSSFSFTTGGTHEKSHAAIAGDLRHSRSRLGHRHRLRGRHRRQKGDRNRQRHIRRQAGGKWNRYVRFGGGGSEGRQ